MIFLVPPCPLVLFCLPSLSARLPLPLPPTVTWAAGHLSSFNLLPQSAIDCSSVSQFQQALTRRARTECQLDSDNWKYLYSGRRLRFGTSFC